MSAATPMTPYDQLGLDAPFAERNDETDRDEAIPAWNASGESPYAEAMEDEEAFDEEPAAANLGGDGLAWLDMESESAAETEYLDDEERDADESYESFDTQAPADRFEAEDEGAAVSLTGQQRTWILALDRSAIERLPDATLRSAFLQQDWSDIEFPGNVPRGQAATSTIKAHWGLARSLFEAMASVVPERRVPSSIRFRERPVVRVPGQPSHRLFAEARDSFVRMHAAAKADGVDLVILSSWRSLARQAAASAAQPNPNAVARKASAHMYGLAVDLRMGVPGLPIMEINTRVDRTTAAKAGTEAKMGNLVRMYRSPVYKWLSLRARDFGWFPYRNEPWHWEYNPPGLKARFEGATRGELEDEAQYTHPEGEDEITNSDRLRTFTARALGVKLAVYVTQAARTASQVELMVFAHGLDLCKPLSRNRPATFITERPFKLGELVEASGRPVVLLVPFLDWEHLDANRMGFGRRWHRLAQTDNFNRVAAEALEQVAAITGRDAPALQRLILAGHSRAYGFFDALANQHASAQMRRGALACPIHVWALDTTYSAPIDDWRAWLRSRGDLQATVVYRHGTYKTKDGVRELGTGVRGNQFRKLAASSNGRLTVQPVAAASVSHCGIPSAWLPRLLAALPELQTVGEYAPESESEDEDEAGIATEAETESEVDPVSPIVISNYPRYSTDVPPSHAQLLQPLVTKIVEIARAGDTIHVSIVGHADFDAQGHAFETKVSMDRATVGRQTLLSMLKSQAGVAGLTPEQVIGALDLSLEGTGTKEPRESRPLNEEQRKRNRRVEFFWESPSTKRSLPPLPPPDEARGLTFLFAGVTAAGTDERLNGEGLVRFAFHNDGYVPTTVTITDKTHQVSQSRQLAVHEKAELEFPAARQGLIEEWTFRIQPDPRAQIVYHVYTRVPPKSLEQEFDSEAGEDGEDESAIPDRFDAFGDERDSEWGAESSEELAESLDATEPPPSFPLDQEDEGLAGSGLTPAEQKAVEITSLFETGKPGGFYGLSGNFDGQGLSFGLVNWTIGTGSLQPLLRDFARENPARWAWIFGIDASRFLHLIARKDKQGQKEQHRFAIEEMNTVSIGKGGKRIWTVRQPWVGYFKRLSEDRAFQQIQVRYVRDLLVCAAMYCRRFHLTSERAFCFMFDAVSSHGKWWLKKKFDGVEKRRLLLEQALATLAARSSPGRVPEADALLAIADVLATTSAQRWADNVRRRKRWFVTGQHPRGRELDALRPRADVAYATSSTTTHASEDFADASEWEETVHRTKPPAASGGTGATLVTGAFEPFVGAGRVDRDIAHILNVMDGYAAGSWTRGVARFLLRELESGRLSLIVKNSMVRARIDNVPEEGRAITEEVARDIAEGRFPSMTATYGSNGSALILGDKLVRNGTQPGPGRGEVALKIAHEATHVRNRTRLPARGMITADSFVDVAQAERMGGMDNRNHFMAELACNHVAWRVRKEIDNKWDGRPIPAQPALGAFFKYALELAENGLIDGRNRYLSGLTAGEVTRRQVGLWVRDTGLIADFADDPLNGNAKALCRSTFDAFAPSFTTPRESMDGAIQSW